MLLKTGVDLVEIDRLKNLKPEIRQRFIERVFTPGERAELGDSNQRLSAGFAAKEAVAKALGCGFGPIGWQEVAVHHLPSGEPTLLLYGKAAQLAAAQGLTQWSISISHSRTHAIAMVVGLGETS
jgi:holo-[acyl-carrier protein] synthase